jgi:hypothetical protein
MACTASGGYQAILPFGSVFRGVCGAWEVGEIGTVDQADAQGCLAERNDVAVIHSHKLLGPRNSCAISLPGGWF